MGKGRLEAFSDGVIAIIITIMVLELKAPHDASLEALRPLLPVLLSYLMSFVYVGIYWNNHHHLLHAAGRVNGMTLWANLHLLFWLSLIPFVTNWVGESHFAPWPVAAYGVVLLLSSIAWDILRRVLIKCQHKHGQESLLASAIGTGSKEWLSTGLYLAAILLATLSPWDRGGPVAACVLYCVVALVWFIPDQRIERALAAKA